jgi:predicted 3-demethylubiquinone-9 3-methyltransferase (glyoxalase superfamily)
MDRQKITTHLWFDKEALEAAKLYTSIFKDSQITSQTHLENTPSGDVDMVTANLMGREFMLMSAGPLFKFNPSVSFSVACETKEEVDKLWKELITGGSALMDIGEYPFAERYGWVQDKFGLSWQIMYREGQKVSQALTPTIMFVGNLFGKTKEAINFYTSVFPDSKIGEMMTYDESGKPDLGGNVSHAEFSLGNQDFVAMDGAGEHNFAFNEAISFVVHCKDQTEIDYYWDKLSAVPESEQCGWLKDKYGLSWQIVPNIMEEMMSSGDKDKTARATSAFLKMKKFDIEKLKEAYEGK